ncbi:unnamed protein product [Acanthoscelides obtectus]|uniref:Uncharacterized protein n=1 Tax=Acanthoscelides obtectus TaxID=200917 RepID=A0A9P0PUE7_ACAOB|nr:unnamed protein product [Acanthoscelides obtectus]CAK1650048.1 hypothetical protein AOBTE_LOCUS16571 [Acanthoscelides obtectus]
MTGENVGKVFPFWLQNVMGLIFQNANVHFYRASRYTLCIVLHNKHTFLPLTSLKKYSATRL